MTSTHDNPVNPRDCPNCGLAREDWPDDAAGGYSKAGAVYCCQGCIDGPGCTCRRYVASAAAPTKEEIRADPESGAFVQSLRHQTGHIDDSDYGTDVTKGRPPATSASND
jgi:hypothetical protein